MSKIDFIRRIVNPKSKEDEEFYYKIKELINFKPIKLSHYKKAFTHRSLNIVDKKGTPINYERLEFLGDSLLDAVISTYLYKEAPKKSEGYLTQMRSKIVSRKYLNKVGKNLKLIEFVKSNIPKNNAGNNIHGNIFEALVGAIYLDRGYNYCMQFVYDKIIEPYVNIQELEGKITSYKGLIIEWCQKNKYSYNFETYEDTGKESKKHFSVKVTVNNKVVAKGRSTSKKKAEEQAAKRVYYAFQDKITKP